MVANRLETDLDDVGSSLTLLDGERLERAQLTHLEDALRWSPGLFSESTGGQRGSVSSLFLRGTSTAHAHVRVDGIRLSDSTVQSNNFLGNASLGGISRVEVLRGPQSALYGGESIGGVVNLLSQRGAGAPATAFTAEAGSFSSVDLRLASQGAFDSGLAYALQVGREATHNDPQGMATDLDHHQRAYALRLDYELSADARVGVTFRGGHAEFHDAFGGENFTDYQLVTLFGELNVTDAWESRLRLGAYTEAYDFGAPSTFATDAEKFSLSWENVWAINDHHQLAFGSLWESTDYAQDFAFPGDRDQWALYANHVWEVNDALVLSGGVRWEDYDDYGDEFTWRGTVAYTFPTETTVRASYGTAFRTPNLLELNGSPFEMGNPHLDPERAQGWDIGVTQKLGDAFRVAVTWFESEIEDQILDPFGAAPTNISGSAKAEGLELEASGEVADGLYVGVAYTYLADSLVGLPEHVWNGRVLWEVSDRVDLGLGLSYVDERTLGGDLLDAYFLARIHGRYQVNDHVAVHARLENLFDERYEHASFGGITSPGRRLGAFGGLTISW